MVSTKLVTVDELMALGNGVPYELIEGALHEVSPVFGDSSTVTFQFAYRIAQFEYAHKLGKLTSAEGGFLLQRDPDTLVAPDIAFIRHSRNPKDHDFASFFPFPPDLAVEVVSSSDRSSDLLRKLSLYMEAGTPLVWVVYPKELVVTVWEPGYPPVTLTGSDVLRGGTVLPGFEIEVNRIFTDPQEE